MGAELPTVSYLDALFAAIRGAGKHLEATQRWLKSAEEADGAGWRLQALAAAKVEHAEASACLGEAGEHLFALGSADDLPATLGRLPARLDAMRAELLAAEERLLRLAASARPVGQT
jgi:hypothetical protein